MVEVIKKSGKVKIFTKATNLKINIQLPEGAASISPGLFLLKDASK